MPTYSCRKPQHLRALDSPLPNLTSRENLFHSKEASRADEVFGTHSGRWLNNRAENSHQSCRRREDPMAKFRDIKTLQKFAAVHTSIHNHFNHDRHLNRRDIFRQNRSASLAEWRQLAA
ncbi:MAG: DDE-type integrase/transposase/recombinase [Methyloceanibacter sp.]|uniref:DDE-type integrase/transposase/recombinase n=1 Tax=Methyloceanibacter sp. TaxID=1965321 RepID=UPI003C663716